MQRQNEKTFKPRWLYRHGWLCSRCILLLSITAPRARSSLEIVRQPTRCLFAKTVRTERVTNANPHENATTKMSCRIANDTTCETGDSTREDLMQLKRQAKEKSFNLHPAFVLSLCHPSYSRSHWSNLDFAAVVLPHLV